MASDSLPLINLKQNRVTLLTALSISIGMSLFLLYSIGWRQSALFLVGLAAGLILYHAAFGFTSAWREVVSTGRSAGLRAQMVMLAVTVLVFTPLIASVELAGMPLRGSVAPLSLSVIVGAFIFGAGMQLGGGCASGTLYTAGGGNVRMIVTLAFFIFGSLIGTWQWELWQSVPALQRYHLASEIGVTGAIVASAVIFFVIWLLSSIWEKRQHGSVERIWDNKTPGNFLRGPWPLIAGALALAAVNIATLALAGRPWGVTGGLALWGGKIATLMGLDITGWAYWARPGALASLNGSIFQNVTSVMNIGIMLGALLAACLATKFSPNSKIPIASLLAAAIGGILMGYGARIAFGCNIGAYFGGISSTSLHGWLWFVAAFIGSILGTRFRPVFGLSRS